MNRSDVRIRTERQPSLTCAGERGGASLGPALTAGAPNGSEPNGSPEPNGSALKAGDIEEDDEGAVAGVAAWSSPNRSMMAELLDGLAGAGTGAAMESSPPKGSPPKGSELDGTGGTGAGAEARAAATGEISRSSILSKSTSGSAAHSSLDMLCMPTPVAVASASAATSPSGTSKAPSHVSRRRCITLCDTIR